MHGIAGRLHRKTRNQKVLDHWSKCTEILGDCTEKQKIRKLWITGANKCTEIQGDCTENQEIRNIWIIGANAEIQGDCRETHHMSLYNAIIPQTF